MPTPMKVKASMGAPDVRTCNVKSSTSNGPGAQKERTFPHPPVAFSIWTSTAIAIP